MITIENLEVEFDVDGSSDEEVFARYFARFIAQWERAKQHEQRTQERLQRDRQLGDDGSLG